MSQIGFGDLAQSQLMRRHTTHAKTEISRLSQELTTGQSADTPYHVSGDMGPLLALDSSLSRLSGYGAVTRELGLFADAMQTGLGVISKVALEAANTLIAASGTAATTHVNTATAAAKTALESVMSTLNTRFGDRTLFAGTDTTGQAVASAADLIAAVRTASDGATSADSVEAAVDAWFASPTGYDALIYLGSDPLSSVPIAAGETAALDITAKDPSLKETLKGLVMAAILEDGAFAGQQALRNAVAQRAGETLLAGETDRAHLAAQLGASQAQIDRAQTRNEAETTALQIARNGIVAVDPYEAATRLQDAETQLQLIYTITARISRLSLADYLT